MLNNSVLNNSSSSSNLVLLHQWFLRSQRKRPHQSKNRIKFQCQPQLQKNSLFLI